MGKLGRSLVVLISFLLSSVNTHALETGAFHLGLGLLSENSFGKITRSSSGAKSLTGTSSTPLLIKYDWQVGNDLFFSPALLYSAIPRKAQGDSAQVTLMHLTFNFGENFGNGDWDWSVGPGLLQRTIKGAGGTTVLSNGSSTATFGLPSATVNSRVVTWNAGLGYNFASSRLALDFILEGFTSSKRTVSLLFGYSYVFGGR